MKVGTIEYKMSQEMAKKILKTRKPSEMGIKPQDFLCRYVNACFGLKGNCVKVITNQE